MSTVRITVAGKGGVGKTVISASLARFYGRAGQRVLAVDADSNPVLAISLGVPVERLRDPAPIPTDFWEAVEQLGKGKVALLRDDPAVLSQRHGLSAPDNVTLLAAPVVENEGCTSDAGVRSMLGVMLGKHRYDCVVTDFEAGIDEPAWALGGYFNPADILLVVATPNPVAMRTAQTIVRFAREAEVPRVFGIANQLASDADGRHVEQGFTDAGIDCVARIPLDDAIAHADATGAAPLDVASSSPALDALRDLARRLEQVAATTAA